MFAKSNFLAIITKTELNKYFNGLFFTWTHTDIKIHINSI